MFTQLARGFGSWDGQYHPDRDVGKVTMELPYLTQDSHRHGITVRPKSSPPTSNHGGNTPDGGLVLPKTYITRKGALLLFSAPEGFNLQKQEQLKTEILKRTKLLENSAKIGTLERFTKSVLSFGEEDCERDEASISDQDPAVFLKFLHSLDQEQAQDLKLQPGGDFSFYLDNVKSQTSSRAGTARLERALTSGNLSDRSKGTDRLISADSATLFTRPTSTASQNSSGQDRPATEASQRSFRVLSAERLAAHLKSPAYLGRPASCHLGIHKEDTEDGGKSDSGEPIKSQQSGSGPISRKTSGRSCKFGSQSTWCSESVSRLPKSTPPAPASAMTHKTESETIDRSLENSDMSGESDARVAVQTPVQSVSVTHNLKSKSHEYLHDSGTPLSARRSYSAIPTQTASTQNSTLYKGMMGMADWDRGDFAHVTNDVAAPSVAKSDGLGAGGIFEDDVDDQDVDPSLLQEQDIVLPEDGSSRAQSPVSRVHSEAVQEWRPASHKSVRSQYSHGSAAKRRLSRGGTGEKLAPPETGGANAPPSSPSEAADHLSQRTRSASVDDLDEIERELKGYGTSLTHPLQPPYQMSGLLGNTSGMLAMGDTVNEGQGDSVIIDSDLSSKVIPHAVSVQSGRSSGSGSLGQELAVQVPHDQNLEGQGDETRVSSRKSRHSTASLPSESRPTGRAPSRGTPGTASRKSSSISAPDKPPSKAWEKTPSPSTGKDSRTSKQSMGSVHSTPRSRKSSPGSSRAKSRSRSRTPSERSAINDDLEDAKRSRPSTPPTGVESISVQEVIQPGMEAEEAPEEKSLNQSVHSLDKTVLQNKLEFRPIRSSSPIDQPVSEPARPTESAGIDQSATSVRPVSQSGFSVSPEDPPSEQKSSPEGVRKVSAVPVDFTPATPEESQVKAAPGVMQEEEKQKPSVTTPTVKSTQEKVTKEKKEKVKTKKETKKAVTVPVKAPVDKEVPKPKLTQVLDITSKQPPEKELPTPAPVAQPKLDKPVITKPTEVKKQPITPQPPAGPPKSAVKVKPKVAKKDKEQEALNQLEKEVTEILDSAVPADAAAEGGMSVEELELEQKILQEKLQKAEEKLQEKNTKKKPKKEKTPRGKKGKKEVEKDLAAEREALREAKRLEKLKRLEEAKALENQIKTKESEKEAAEEEARKKREELEEEMEAIRQQEEEAQLAEEEARAMLAATRKIAREERDQRRREEMERKKQEAQRRREEERLMQERARQKEREMLERIADAEQKRMMAEEERRRRDEEDLAEQERQEEEERQLKQAMEEEEERVKELERQAEEEAMTRIVREREEAEKKRLVMQEEKRKLEEQEEMLRKKMELEKQKLEVELRKKEEEELRRQEEEKRRLDELQRMEEEARSQMRQEMEKRREAALLRREQNLERRNNLDGIKRSQGLTKPWVFSYYILWPRETYEKPMGEDPKKKKGFRPKPKAKPPAASK